eukprot:5154747-Prymnesium_polylepis.1
MTFGLHNDARPPTAEPTKPAPAPPPPPPNLPPWGCSGKSGAILHQLCRRGAQRFHFPKGTRATG